MDWPCGQNPGRNPEGRQRASARETNGASANRVPVQGQHSPTCYREKGSLETLADTLVERVSKLVEGGKEPLLSTTPTSVAIRELVARNEALENAVREIALEVQKLSAQG